MSDPVQRSCCDCLCWNRKKIVPENPELCEDTYGRRFKVYPGAIDIKIASRMKALSDAEKFVTPKKEDKNEKSK